MLIFKWFLHLCPLKWKKGALCLGASQNWDWTQFGSGFVLLKIPEESTCACQAGSNSKGAVLLCKIEIYLNFSLQKKHHKPLTETCAALPKHFSANYPQHNPHAQSWAPHFCRGQEGRPDKTSINLLWSRNLLSHPSSDLDLAAASLTSAQEVTSAKWVWNRKLV